MADWPTIPAGAGYPLVDASTGEFLSTAVNGALSATYGRGLSVLAFGATGSGTSNDAPAITAAIAAANPGDSIYFPRTSAHYRIDSTVTVNKAVRLVGERGTRIVAGQHRSFSVTAADVVFEGLRIERSATQANPSDSLAARSNVAVNAARFTSRDVDYVNASHACVYFTHATCDGARIYGGSATNSSTRRNASMFYAAAGVTGNNDILVSGVKMTGAGAPDAVLFFDCSDSTVQDCVITGMRKIATVTLTGWTLVSGNVWRTLDARTDNNPTMILRRNGTQLTDEVDTTTPNTNAWGLNGGYVYVNLGGADPNASTMTSAMPSGYGITFYWTENGYPGMNRNKAVGNRISDCDGFGIYMQFQNTPEACRDNMTANNILRDVCLAGIQHQSLAFAGIGWGGGTGCLSSGDQIYVSGSPSATAPGVRMQNQSSGRLVGVMVYGATASGFDIASQNWSLIGCVSNSNGRSGFRIFSNQTGQSWRGIELLGCRAGNNAISGVEAERVTSGSVIQVSIVGGYFAENTQRGVALTSCQDSKVVGATFHNNGGSSFYAVDVRGSSTRCTVSDVIISGFSSNQKGVLIDSATVDCSAGTITFTGSGGTPVPLSHAAPIRTAGVLGGIADYRGAGTPEGVVTAAVGSRYVRTDGGAGTTLYVKESGTGNTGWVGK